MYIRINNNNFEWTKIILNMSNGIIMRKLNDACQIIGLQKVS